jgi:hypothetical protein
MSNLTRNLQILFNRELDSLIRELELFDDEFQIWVTKQGII